jgi:uncharacterized damage-inducible protein DinB
MHADLADIVEGASASGQPLPKKDEG